MAAGTLALIIPNIFNEDIKSVRIAWFVDGGQVYDVTAKDTQYMTNATGLRYSTGLSLTWMSPMAPLVFSLATPLNERPGDNVQRFAFTFGTVF